MALTYIGATSFSQSGPEQWRLGQFELDQMSVPFSGAATGLTTYVSSLTRGSAWSGDANMYLTGWNVSDSNKQYPTVTQEYIGAKGGTLPSVEHQSGDAVQSAHSNTSSLIFPNVATSPVTVTYYAPSTSISAISTSDTTATEPDDPPDVTSLITWDINGEQVGTSFPDIADFILNECFIQRIVETETADEIVAGRYWKITKRKTKTLYPYAPDS